MFAKATLFVAALQASLAMAGNAIISNRCDYDVYMRSAGIGFQPTDMIKIPAGTQHTEARCTGTCNTSFKISKTDSIVAGEHTQFEYSVVNGNQLWYDISLVDCANGESADNCPGHDGGLAVNGGASGCGSADCAAGSYCPSMAYFVDQPLIKLGVKEPVFTCPSGNLDMDLVFKLCSGNAPTKRSIAGRLMIDAIA